MAKTGIKQNFRFDFYDFATQRSDRKWVVTLPDGEKKVFATLEAAKKWFRKAIVFWVEQNPKRNSSSTSTRTEVRSPTSTKTSTEAETTGNVTVTGGAGAGANTHVTIIKRNGIVKITKAYIRHYVDNGQTTAYVEWIDNKGKTGRTEGKPSGLHMQALLARAKREGVAVTKETWNGTQKRNATASGFKQHQSKKLSSLARMFQGVANGDKKRVLESDYTPKDKYRLGYLVQLKIKDAGKVIPIDFDGESYLAGDLKNNLWIVGKDSRIENIKLPAMGQMKYLGELVQIDYVTAKKHIENNKTVRFYHKLGEVTREKPNLFIDDEGFPIIIGGGFDIWDVGIVN